DISHDLNFDYSNIQIFLYMYKYRYIILSPTCRRMEKTGKTEIDLYVINKIKEIRIAKGLTQSDLALALGMSNGFIGQIESPRYRAKYNVSHLYELSRILECSPK